MKFQRRQTPAGWECFVDGFPVDADTYLTEVAHHALLHGSVDELVKHPSQSGTSTPSRLRTSLADDPTCDLMWPGPCRPEGHPRTFDYHRCDRHPDHLTSHRCTCGAKEHGGQ